MQVRKLNMSSFVRCLSIQTLLRTIVCKIRTIFESRGHCISPISLIFCMLTSLWVLTTKWMILSFNYFYFAKYREGRFRAALRVRHFDKSWEFLCIQLSARKLRNSVNFYTDVKNYPSFMYLYKSI